MILWTDNLNDISYDPRTGDEDDNLRSNDGIKETRETIQLVRGEWWTGN